MIIFDFYKILQSEEGFDDKYQVNKENVALDTNV